MLSSPVHAVVRWPSPSDATAAAAVAAAQAQAQAAQHHLQMQQQHQPAPAQPQGSASVSPPVPALSPSGVTSPLQALMALKAQEGPPAPSHPHHHRRMSTSSASMQDIACNGSPATPDQIVGAGVLGNGNVSGSGASTSTAGSSLSQARPHAIQEDGDGSSISSGASVSPPVVSHPVPVLAHAAHVVEEHPLAVTSRMEDVTIAAATSHPPHHHAHAHVPMAKVVAVGTRGANGAPQHPNAHVAPHHFDYVPHHAQAHYTHQVHHSSPPHHQHHPQHHHHHSSSSGSGSSGFRPSVPLSPSLSAATAPSSTATASKRGQGFSCHHCLDGDTPVATGSGFSLPIKTVAVGTPVVSFDAAQDGHVLKSTSAFLKQGEKECVELLFNDGRTIICTPNHRFLMDDGRWVEAQHMKLAATQIKAGVEYPLLQLPQQEQEDAAWTLELPSLRIALNTSDRLPHALAFAGLLGYLLSSGCVSQTSKQSCLRLSHRLDAEWVLRDIQLLTGVQQAAPVKTTTTRVALPAALHQAMQHVGASADERLFPAFLLAGTCPPAVVQAFLGGLFGSNGEAPSLRWDADGRVTALTDVQLIRHVSSVCSGAERELTTQLKALFARVGLSTDAICLVPRSSNKGSARQVWRVSGQSTLAFAGTVGFRYASAKQLQLTAAASYHRMQAALRHQKECLEALSVHDALEAFDCIKLFDKAAVSPSSRALPTFRVQVISRRAVAGVRPVFDLTVPDTENFQVAGLVGHNCKTHKQAELLLFCSNQSKKGPGKKRCRKKYCDSCLRRLYGHPADVPLQDMAAHFQCPACLGNCVCAGCERKAGANNASASSASAATNGNANGSANEAESPHSSSADVSPAHHTQQHTPTSATSGAAPLSARTPSPGPIAMPSSSSSSSSPAHGHHHIKPPHLQQTKPTTPLGKPPGKKRRTSIDMGVAMEEATAAVTAAAAAAANGANQPTPAQTAAAQAVAAAQAAAANSSFAPSPPRHHGRTLSGSSNDIFSVAAGPFLPPPSPASTGLVFNVGSTLVRHSSGGGAAPTGPSGTSSLTVSPRLAALAATSGSQQGSRMIHVPAFALGNSGSGINGGGAGASSSAGTSPRLMPSMLLGGSAFGGGLGSSTSTPTQQSQFPPHVQQQVQQAVAQAAALAAAAGGASGSSSAMDTSSSSASVPDLLLGGGASGSHASPSLNPLSATSAAGTSPFSTPVSLARRLSSAFSPVTNPSPGPGAASSLLGATANEESSSLASLPPKPSPPSSSLASNVLSAIVGGSAGVALPAQQPRENELMRVLATVACSANHSGAASSNASASPTNSTPGSAVGVASTPAMLAATSGAPTNASLPPTHPVSSSSLSALREREMPSPKLSSSFMTSVSLLSPTHGASAGSSSSTAAAAAAGSSASSSSSPSLQPLNLPSSSLASLSAAQAHLRAQHQMELQCLLQSQQLQLVELERQAIREFEGQQQAMWQQQQMAQLRSSQQQLLPAAALPTLPSLAGSASTASALAPSSFTTATMNGTGAAAMSDVVSSTSTLPMATTPVTASPTAGVRTAPLVGAKPEVSDGGVMKVEQPQVSAEAQAEEAKKPPPASGVPSEIPPPPSPPKVGGAA